MKRLPSLMIRLGITPILALLTLMVLAGPDHVQAQECDYSILDQIDEDEMFYYGIGDGSSRMRQLARSQSMALARSELALKYQAEVATLVQNAMEQVGFDDPTIAAATSQATIQFAEAYVTDSRVTNSHTCREGTDWNVFLVLQVAKGSILEDLVEQVEEELQEEIETGDAEYSREQTDKLFEQVNDELEKRRAGGGQA